MTFSANVGFVEPSLYGDYRPVSDIQQPGSVSLKLPFMVGGSADKAAVIFDTKDNVVWLIGFNSHSRIG